MLRKPAGDCGSNCEACQNNPDAQRPTRDSRVASVDSPSNVPGGPKVEGVKHTLLPLVIGIVKEIINNEMNAVVKELKEELADVTEQSVLGTVVEEVQEKVRNTAPVFDGLNSGIEQGTRGAEHAQGSYKGKQTP